MTKQVQRRRGTATQHTSFTGAEGEISVNTTNKSVHVHDGTTAGGIEAARADMTNVTDANLNARLNGNTLSSLTITSADINGGTIDGTVIGGSTPAAVTGTTITGTSFVTTGDMTFGDNDKAIFGAGSDLQIYHDGSHSYVTDEGAGNLYLRSNGNGIVIQATTSEDSIVALANGAVTLYYDNAAKFATTATGVDVTGDIGADTATISGNLTVDTNTLFVDAANNRVGIGTVNPNYALELNASGSGDVILSRQTGVDGADLHWLETSVSPTNNLVTFKSTGSSNGGFTFNHASTEFMRIDSSGNVGIGVTDMSASGANAKLAVAGGVLNLDDTQAIAWGGGTSRPSVNGVKSTGFLNLLSPSNIAFSTNSTERMRIDSSGNLLVGTTTGVGARLQAYAAATQHAVYGQAQSYDWFPLLAHNTATSNNNSFVSFGTEASYTQRGSISYNRAGGLVAYNTTSDYRAKNIAGPIEDASSTVLSLKPYMGTMKDATTERPMFVAHETQEVAPYAVTGEKDAVDQDGNPKYQQMDHSTLVPLLTAALQEALTRIEVLEARVAALEA